jgi:hypothetical protein
LTPAERKSVEPLAAVTAPVAGFGTTPIAASLVGPIALVRREGAREGPGADAALDRTKLSVGASAQVKLDRFVYDVSGSPRTVVLTAAKGVARFVSGSGPSSAYQVRTPHATIGVRGTVFDVLVQPSRTVVCMVPARSVAPQALRSAAHSLARACE